MFVVIPLPEGRTRHTANFIDMFGRLVFEIGYDLPQRWSFSLGYWWYRDRRGFIIVGVTPPLQRMNNQGRNSGGRYLLNASVSFHQPL